MTDLLVDLDCHAVIQQQHQDLGQDEVKKEKGMTVRVIKTGPVQFLLGQGLSKSLKKGVLSTYID